MSYLKSMPKKEEITRISKKLTYLLRHGAEKEGLKMGNDGYVNVKDLLMKKELKTVTMAIIMHIVKTDEKQRFKLIKDSDSGEYYIRANQGHSLMNVEIQMEKITTSKDIPCCIHGTFKNSWNAILKTGGLSKMGRQHIHFASGRFGEEGIISGLRKTCEILIYVDIDMAISDGIVFYRSENGVILSEGVDGILNRKYFKKVVDLTKKPEEEILF